MMIKNYLKIAFRNIARQKIYSFINIAGLTIGLTCFFLILLYIRYELSYESQHKNRDKIYRVNVVQQHPNNIYRLSHSMVPLGVALEKEVPEINDFTRFQPAGKTLFNSENKKFYEDNVDYVDPSVFAMFTLPVIQGDPHSALREKYSVVITESIARKYFGDQNPLGQTLTMDNNSSLTVTAVINDFPHNTHVNPDFMISFNTLDDFVGENFMNNWVTTRLITYVMITNHQNIPAIEQKINQVMEAHSSTEVKRSLELEQFSRIHLYSEISVFGNIAYIYLFLAIGVLILAIASINFMNLSTARSARRANEIGMRKVTGASRWQLLAQFMGESIFLSFIALALALLLLDTILPQFRQITGQELLYPGFSDWHFYGLILLVTLIVGILSGSYPAFYLAAFPPISTLRGGQGLVKNDAYLRKILVLMQFSIAIALIIATVSISQQLDFMQNKDLGFKKDQIVIVPTDGGDFLKDLTPFKQALLKNSNIRSVSGSLLLPSRIGMYNNVTWEGAGENESIALIQNKVDYDFLDTYEIPLTEGRNFSRSMPSDILDYSRDHFVGAVILNQEAVKKFGWKNPLGKTVIQTYGKERHLFNVIGVIKDFHFASLHYKIEPLSLFLRPANPWRISIKIKAQDVQNTIAHIRNTWNTFNPQFPFEYYFLDETFEKSYQSEENIRQLFSYFSLLSIFISCLGLFGLSAFAAEKRVKEIGVRKVMGASVSNILILLSREFTKWVLIANIVAWPFAWWYLNNWLNEFAYRTSLGWWIFIFAGSATFVIALITVSVQATKAALSNPVDALRYE